MSSSRDIHPLGRLYNKLDSKLDDRSVGKMKTVLRGRQVDIRDMQSFNTPADVFLFLEDKGTINENDLSFLKTLMNEIDRQPLVADIEQCEEELRNSQMAGDSLSAPLPLAAVPNADDLVGNLMQSALFGKYGRIKLQNRDIEYEAKGRFHSLFEYVYDGWARDISSRREATVAHCKTEEDAVKGAIKKLVKELQASSLL